MSKINKVGEHKVDACKLEDYPIVVCSECGEETKIKTIYRDVRTVINSEEMSLISIDFEECDRSCCCEETVFLTCTNSEEIHDDEVYNYFDM